jgi:MFS family permease
MANSATLERDARLAHADDHAVDPGEIAVGVVIGRTSEFFDFFVYAIGSVLVFPRLFFPDFDPFTGTLYSFAIFSLAFVARPIGSFIFTAIDRRHGRGTKLTIALFLLGGSTAAISFLPGYARIGAEAIVFLALFRIGQGLALGGAWDGLASLLALNAPEHRRGWYAMMPQLGAPLGFILAGGLFAFLINSLPDADFLEWGWRYPFFVAFALNVVALFARLRLVATREFANMLDKHELQPVRISELVRSEGLSVVIGAFVPLACFALFHLVTVFPLAWISLNTDRSPANILSMQMAGAFVAIIAIVFSGLIADRIGRRRLLAIGAGLIALFSFAAPLAAGWRAHGRDDLPAVGLRPPGPFLRAGERCRGGALLQPLPLHRLGPDVRYRLAGGRRLRAAGGAGSFRWLGVGAVGGYLLSGAVCTMLALTSNRQLEIRDN